LRPYFIATKNDITISADSVIKKEGVKDKFVGKPTSNVKTIQNEN